MAITEHGLEGQFLVQCKAHRQGHLAGFGVTNQNDVCALLRHLNGLAGSDFCTSSLDNEVAAQTIGQVENRLDSILFAAVDHTVCTQFKSLIQTLLHDIYNVNTGNTLGFQRHHGDQTNAACTHDHRSLTGMSTALIGGVETNGQRLDQRTFHGAYVVR